MKKQIYVLLFSIIGLVCYSLFYNAKTHVKTIEVVDELVEKADSLDTKVKVLHKQKDSVLTELKVMDSTITSKDSLITLQKANIWFLKKDASVLKTVAPIIIRDTVYVTEYKNFWGKKIRSIESTSNTDTLDLDLYQDSVIVDTTSFN